MKNEETITIANDTAEEAQVNSPMSFWLFLDNSN